MERLAIYDNDHFSPLSGLLRGKGKLNGKFFASRLKWLQKMKCPLSPDKKFTESCFTKIPNLEEVQLTLKSTKEPISLFGLYVKTYTPDIWIPIIDNIPKYPMRQLESVVPDIEGVFYRLSHDKGKETLREMY